MFQQGIPALLSFENREDLIRNYVEKFSLSTTWCGVGIGHGELKRVAQPELSPVVRELWQDAYTGYETRELFLKLIYLAFKFSLNSLQLLYCSEFIFCTIRFLFLHKLFC